ncbi:unnamed protein product [Toxocara canis]|uniref:Lactamase_B domain-containing protein n=1 Tax=Toxocara canis TaxID=6265 RepID=A0A183UBU8_TOXCA|nr:unnamed protein product [Toxocara canis]
MLHAVLVLSTTSNAGCSERKAVQSVIFVQNEGTLNRIIPCPQLPPPRCISGVFGSGTKRQQSKAMFHFEVNVTAIAVNEDNYSYMVVCEESGDCALVDVGDAKPVLKTLDETARTPSAVLSTHKHWDHCYGNKEMLEKFSHLKLYGSKLDQPHCANKLVKNGEVIEVGKLRFTVILVPGHTKGHAIYRLHTENGPDCLFTGDFLFIAGIGKMFEGSAKRMLRSLSFLDNLPRSALVFPGHEYSMENIEFALRLEPSNGALLAVDRLVRDRRMHKLPSQMKKIGRDTYITEMIIVRCRSLE